MRSTARVLSGIQSSWKATAGRKAQPPQVLTTLTQVGGSGLRKTPPRKKNRPL